MSMGQIFWAGLLPGALADTSEQLIPVPEFSDHAIPTTSVPSASTDFWEYLDVGVLLVALVLASYFALRTRSRRHLFILTVFSLLWFGFWRQGCVCSIGATQNVSLAIFDSTYVIPLGVVAFFVLPLVFTLFFGRTFCAAVCPLGAVQELVAVRSVRVPSWLDHVLGLVAYIYLGVAVILAATGTAFLICRYDPFVAFFRLGGNANMLVFGACLLVIGLFVGRPYCRYLCPLGAIFRVLSRFSWRHVRIPPEQCINCRLCEDVCPYGAIEAPTGNQPATERSRGKRQLALMLLAAPLLVALFAWLGTTLGGPLSRTDPEVRLAEQLRREETGMTETTTDASEAFRNTGRPAGELYQAAVVRREHFGVLGGWLGAWVGFVIGAKLIHLSLRKRRTEYEPNRSGCVSCGRCFWYCPVEQVRLGIISDPSEVVPAETDKEK
jgi:Fe-S-cluster-containing hydrogenase component 2